MSLLPIKSQRQLDIKISMKYKQKFKLIMKSPQGYKCLLVSEAGAQMRFLIF